MGCKHEDRMIAIGLLALAALACDGLLVLAEIDLDPQMSLARLAGGPRLRRQPCAALGIGAPHHELRAEPSARVARIVALSHGDRDLGLVLSFGDRDLGQVLSLGDRDLGLVLPRRKRDLLLVTTRDRRGGVGPRLGLRGKP